MGSEHTKVVPEQAFVVSDPQALDADVQAFLNMPMVGLPENSQILHSELIHPSAYHETTKLCAIYQISILLDLDYEKLCDAFRPLLLMGSLIVAGNCGSS